jgi:hypothetical protein
VSTVAEDLRVSLCFESTREKEPATSNTGT